MNAVTPVKVKHIATDVSPSVEPAKVSPLQILVSLEGEALAATDRLALKHMAVHKSRKLIPSGHIFWLTNDRRSVKIEAMSSQSDIDKTSPFIQWMRGQLEGRLRAGDLSKPHSFDILSRREADDFAYPFNHAAFAPFPNGGLLFTRNTSFTESETALITRLSTVYGTAWQALGAKKRARMTPRKRTIVWGTAAVLALAAFIPVPMTTLAPTEIVAANPYIVTAPIEGVIDQILVPPNTVVKKGTALIRLVDTSYRNEYILAEGEETVARAKLRQASLTAFVDDAAKREIAVAKAEEGLAGARKSYARDRLSKTTLLAPMDGVALFSNPQDWAGRPVATGEAILQVADPTRVLLRIDAPLTSGETLQSGARVRLFLDSKPLTAIEAELGEASYYAESLPDGQMAFTAYAKITDNTVPRIGSRGVAKIYGRKAPLGYWLARKPITLARQFTGL
jgi:multidrug resistance efflux pump